MCPSALLQLQLTQWVAHRFFRYLHSIHIRFPAVMLLSDGRVLHFGPGPLCRLSMILLGRSRLANAVSLTVHTSSHRTSPPGVLELRCLVNWFRWYFTSDSRMAP